MNKKLTLLLTSVLLTVPLAANAAYTTSPVLSNAPVVAVLDTALDTSLPDIKSHLLYEVCILEWPSCPNGKTFMEGENSSVLPMNILSSKNFNHGTQMTSALIAANQNIRVIFIRIIGNTSAGVRQNTGEATVLNALKWVDANKAKYNIQAVSMSQGMSATSKAIDYCRKTPNTEAVIKNLNSSDIPVFFAAGNARNYTQIDWPSCLPSSIAVGATDTNDEIATYSNYDSKLIDFYALGSALTLLPGGNVFPGSGTSIATQVAAANWVDVKSKKPTLKYQELYDLLSKTSKQTVGINGMVGKLINSNGAING